MINCINTNLTNLAVRVAFAGIASVVLLTGGQLQAADRLDLEQTTITGSKELPKVLYVVPWKSSDIGAMAGMSIGGSFQQGMVTIDREVFQREIQYFNMLEGPEILSKK